ncbi:MAG TPA: spermidine/putrescine ABC transporter substrate-binding protein [candidate division Zixibacteria bacterium]|nr:spermidine/putrescine ABC transporter substrate-binding protein [candidate division Zixibacteria bacterium]
MTNHGKDKRRLVVPGDPARKSVLERALQRRMDRRRFLTLSGSSLAMAALAACAPPGTSPRSSGGGGGGSLGDTLNIATWPNYHDQATLDKFTAETGVQVNIGVYGSTEEMEAKIRAGNSGLDIAVPSNYAVKGWTSDGLIEELDYAKLPSVNLADWNPLFVDQEFDPGNKYTIPKNWGTTGIAFRTDRVTSPPSSWAEFFEMAGDEVSGKTVIVDHQISSLGSAAVALGYGFNTIDKAELADIEEMLTELKPKLFAITSDVQPPLRNYDSWMTIAWTGDGVQVVRDNPDTAKYIIASDGGELWVDSWSVVADAPHREAAYAFLDFILKPENSAADTNFCLFPHANPAVKDLVDEEVANNEVIYPPDEQLQKLTFATADAYNSPLRAETWARIKASS